jgi:DNA-binding NarL/FixJ family response regulator
MSFTAKLPETSNGASPAVSSATSTRKCRVLLVDDHPVTRQGVRAVLATASDLEVCAEANDSESALRLVAALHPDLAVVDVSLAGANGIELTRELMQQSPQLRVLVMSMHEETAYAERALRAGARGYLMKHEAGDKVLTALHQLMRGDVFIGARVQERMSRRLPPKRKLDVAFPIDTLSDREREVFELIGDGYSTRQIGERLGLSSKTIDSYREHLKLKLGLESGAALVRHAIEWGRTKGPL